MALLSCAGLQQVCRHLRTDCRLRAFCQPARHPCAAFCVCATTGLATAKDVSGPSQLGHSLTEHHGSAGSAPAAPSSRSQAGPLAAVATMDAEVSAGQPSSGRKPPWNKGRSIPEETRAKISLAQKRRWKKNPDLHATVGAKLQGKTPWNKGLKLSDETRAKMSAAHLNSTHRVSTRKKISRAHEGKRHTPEAVARMSAVHAGRPKSSDHKLALAATQRRRHAACRVLSAIEEVHGAAAETPRFDPSRFRNSNPGASSSGLKGVKGSRPPTHAQVLATYRNQLREYRALQEELTPWTHAFQERHGRKPRLSDVEHTGVEWLIAKYKCYMMMRERLVMDTPQLRSKLTSAKPGTADALTSVDDYSGASSGGAISSGAARFAAAMDHRRSQASGLTPPSDLAAVAAVPSGPQANRLQPAALQSRGHASVGPWAAAAAAAPAADAATLAAGDAASSPLQPASSSSRLQEPPTAGAAVRTSKAAGGAQQQPELAGGPATGPPGAAALPQGQPASPKLRTLQAAPANAPQRVRSAMSAALQYRAKKAAEVAAAANSAASAAALPPAARRPRSGAALPAKQAPSDAAGRA